MGHCMMRMGWLLLLLVWLGGSSSFSQEVEASSDSLGAAQPDTAARPDTAAILAAQLASYRAQLDSIWKQRHVDSLRRQQLRDSLATLRQDKQARAALLNELHALEAQSAQSAQIGAQQRARIDSLRATAKGFPAFGPNNDTLFIVYDRLGAYTPAARAQVITTRVREAYKEDCALLDTIQIEAFDTYWNVHYGDLVITTITPNDALWENMSPAQLAEHQAKLIEASLLQAHHENSLARWLMRIGSVILAIAATVLVIYLIHRLYRFALGRLQRNRFGILKDLKYRNYTLLSREQEQMLLGKLLNALRWFAILLALYLLIPVVLSIFPFTRGWSDQLFHLIWMPVVKMARTLWNYLPNVFTIAVILVVVHYVLRLIRYFFRELAKGKLKIKGFYPDLARPTYSILKGLTYAFALVLIFPYLPGSDSPVFQGVSVFLGLLISLGSTSAIGNMVAGLVITYMRPFQIGDRIKIGDTQGDVLEKGLLVTRIKSITNEVVTIPNAMVLSTKTLNYSSDRQARGIPRPTENIIVWVTVPLGYEVPWRKAYDLLLEAAGRTQWILDNPKPFVLQMDLADFYAVYQINVYTDEPKNSLAIRSQLYENIQDMAVEYGVDLNSPHIYAHSPLLTPYAVERYQAQHPNPPRPHDDYPYPPNAAQ